MTRKRQQDQQEFGIGAVAKLTGLTDHTIRVWERRYNAVVTERADNGRRIYTVADVEKLGLLKQLTDQGISIGKIAGSEISRLREQVTAMSNMAALPTPDSIRVAVLGEFLPGRLASEAAAVSPLELVVVDSNRERFKADLRRHCVDVVVVESPVLNASTLSELRDCMDSCGAQRAVLVYGFGRTSDIKLARDSRIVVVRSPANVDEICAAVERTYRRSSPQVTPIDSKLDERPTSDWRFSGAIAPRRLSQQQLANLANTASAVECECPQHLAQLVADLSAFEIYSANCAARDDEDAALHRYLHQTTAEARALIEVALERVADAEGLTY